MRNRLGTASDLSNKDSNGLRPTERPHYTEDLMSNELQITREKEGDILIFEIQESRISEGPVIDALSREFEAAIGNGNCEKILLDLHQVELMSSGMLSVLVRLYRELAERNGRFVLCGARPPVLKVFDMTRLDQLFRLEPDVTHGVSRLNR